MNELSSRPRLYIDKDAIKYNFEQIKKYVEEKVEVMPVIKANAYGVGINEIAQIFKDSKYLAVADIEEGIELKNILPNANILILYQPSYIDIKKIIENDIIPSVGDKDFIIKLNEEAKKQNKICNIHVEIDALTSRTGVLPKELKDFAIVLKNLTNLKVDGVFMHYSSADSLNAEDLTFTKNQTNLFDNAIEELESIIGPVNYIHASAGPGIFNPNAKHYNMVRPGYILYGYYHNVEHKKMIHLKPALKLSALIIRIADYDENTPISYNRRYITNRKRRIATVGIGYADGLSRHMYEPNLNKQGYLVVNNQKAPVTGNVCMDLTMIDITDIEGEVKVGDEVYILDNEMVTIEDLANTADTIGHEIIARLNSNVNKIVVSKK